MNFLSLEYFLAVMEAGSFTAAANRLYISQQSLSEQIKKLEDEVGTQLINRKRPLELTPAGRILADAAQTILDTKANALRNIADSLSQNERQLNLGITTYEVPPLLSELLVYFVEQYPSINVTVTKQPESTIASNMDGIDLYFSIPPISNQLDHVYFIKNDYYCLVARQSLFERTYGDQAQAVIAELRQSHDLSSVPNLPFIVLKDFSGKVSLGIRALFDSFHYTPVLSFQSDNGDLNSSFCLRGSGARIGVFFLMFSRYREYINQGDDPLLLFPLKTKRNSAPMVISHVKNKVLNTAEICFLNTAKTFLTRYNAEHFTDSIYDVDKLPDNLFY